MLYGRKNSKAKWHRIIISEATRLDRLGGQIKYLENRGESWCATLAKYKGSLAGEYTPRVPEKDKNKVCSYCAKWDWYLAKNQFPYMVKHYDASYKPENAYLPYPKVEYIKFK